MGKYTAVELILDKRAKVRAASPEPFLKIAGAGIQPAMAAPMITIIEPVAIIAAF
jgi:hypothetical protein